MNKHMHKKTDPPIKPLWNVLMFILIKILKKKQRSGLNLVFKPLLRDCVGRIEPMP